MAPIYDVRGSPRVFKAAHLLFTNPAIDTNDATRLAGYSRHEISCRRIRKSISKKKGRLMQANAKDNKKRAKAPTVITTTTKAFSLSDLTVQSNSSSKNSSTAASKKNGTKVSVASGRKKVQPHKNTFAKVQIAKSCRCTPNQVKAADIQCNEAITTLQAAYKWAVS
jgi:hypothetical protein